MKGKLTSGAGGGDNCLGGREGDVGGDDAIVSRDEAKRSELVGLGWIGEAG